MRGKFIYLILLLISAVSCSKNDSQYLDSKAYSVILIAGQSNTNAGIGLDRSIDKSHGNIKQFGRFSEDNYKIIKAKEPLQHHTAKKNKIGFGLQFAKKYYDYNSSKDILIIPCGYGGTSFLENRWNKGNDLYNDAVARVKTVLEKNNYSELVAILWHQGESDLLNPNYQKNLDQFFNDIREDLDAKEVPVVLGGMVPYWVGDNPRRINQQSIISKSPERHDFMGYANPELPFVIEKEDNTIDAIHYDAQGQRELGKRYFEEFLKIVE